MILLDWTRMGKTYCLAGAVAEKGSYRIVRPLLAKGRTAAVRNVGWSAWLLDGHSRWESFELIAPQPAEAQPPHVEDLWVHSLKPRRCLASPDERRAILAATTIKADEPIFGAELLSTRTAAYLQTGGGKRSLATLIVPAAQMAFAASRREGALAADFRVCLPVPGIGERSLPVKDHHLLRHVEQVAKTTDGQLLALKAAAAQMGEQVAVRVGLSRAFQSSDGNQSVCWLMADGFFSPTDPQP